MFELLQSTGDAMLTNDFQSSIDAARTKAPEFQPLCLTPDLHSPNAYSSLVSAIDVASMGTIVTEPYQKTDYFEKAKVEVSNSDKSELSESPPTPVQSTPRESLVSIRAPEQKPDVYAPAATRLRYMIKALDRIIVCPGVYDGLSARIALEVGFEGIYMTGAGTTASRLGAADLGIAELHDMRTNAEMIANLDPHGPPLIADMDTGYGGPIVIARAVQQYHLAGVAGFHIEDQIAQKRCGHLKGKEVVDVETYIQRIKACVTAAKRLHSDIVIIARTDALQSRGFDDCVERLKRARDEGADMGILEGVGTKEQALRAVQELAPWPLCYNSVENGHSPLISVGEAQAMGYRAIIFSFAGISPAYTAIKSTFDRLKTQGVTGSSVTPKSIFQICGLDESMIIDAAAGGNAFVKGV
ncbi:hypothetical protein MBLNU459_g5838t1 [Dothideomycetes sp. NU459]